MVFSFKTLKQIRINIYKSLPKYNESAKYFPKNEPAPKGKKQKSTLKSKNNQSSNSEKNKTIILQDNINIQNKNLQPSLGKETRETNSNIQLEKKETDSEIFEELSRLSFFNEDCKSLFCKITLL